MIGKLNILLFFLLLCIHQSNRLKKFATILPNNCLPSRFALMRLGKQLAERERISEIIWNIFLSFKA
jgi:type I restriction-modification system DNA methylase subunit